MTTASEEGFVWHTTRQLELSADRALLVESLIPDHKLLRRLTHVGGHCVPDLTVLARRFHSRYRIVGEAALLLTSRKTRLTCHHPMRVASLGVERLCRALAFADTALPSDKLSVDERNATSAAAAALLKPLAAGVVWAASVPQQAIASPLAIEHWVALQALQGNDDIVLMHLRRQEAYQLTRFLLQPGLEEVDLKALARRYGLSYSQFRMLCKRTLGGAAKAQRNRWRAGRALLSMILDGDSVIDAAVAHGYASASHISSEIKREFGRSPSHFVQAHRFLHVGK